MFYFGTIFQDVKMNEKQFVRVPFFLIYPETPIFCRVTKIELGS